jgi:hypothetical protein
LLVQVRERRTVEAFVRGHARKLHERCAA